MIHEATKMFIVMSAYMDFHLWLWYRCKYSQFTCNFFQHRYNHLAFIRSQQNKFIIENIDSESDWFHLNNIAARVGYILVGIYYKWHWFNFLFVNKTLKFLIIQFTDFLFHLKNIIPLTFTARLILVLIQAHQTQTESTQCINKSFVIIINAGASIRSIENQN